MTRLLSIGAIVGLLIGAVVSWLFVIDHRVAPRFSLSDQTGAARSERDYHGSLALIYFGYTFCPDVCPKELGYLARVITGLGPAGRSVTPIFVSVDPQRDTTVKLAEYVHLFHDRMVGLTGTPDQVTAAAREFGVYYQRVDIAGTHPGFYLMNHSSIIYVLDQQGMIVDHLDSHVPVDQAVARIKRFL